MADIDPKFLLVGWLTGGMIAGLVRQSQNKPQLPEGVLISSDGYMLKDSNGLYLCAKKEPVAYRYNLLDFGGYYYSEKIDNDYTGTRFDSGEFPLQTFTAQTLTQESEALAQSHNIHLTGLTLKAGQRIQIETLFPSVSFGELIYEQQRYSYSFTKSPLGAACYVEYNWNKDGKLEYKPSSGGLLTGYSLETINNAAGEIIGFKLSGTLAYDLVYVNISCSTTEFSNTKPFSFTSEAVYSSYDDLKITVYE